MNEINLREFNKRIGLNTDLKNISKQICEKYDLGEFIFSELIQIGYEDYNFRLKTSKGKFCVKIFSKSRTAENLHNYLDRIRAVSNSEISSPKPLLIDGDIIFSLDYEGVHYDICVFDYIDGKNYYEIKKKPDEDIIKELAKQAALINNLKFKPKFIYDSWAIINFEKEYSRKKKYLPKDYQNKFDQLAKKLSLVDFSKLPKAFVHGDIISTNVMLDNNSKIWILDFAVSNYLPRIIDLAVISSNLCLEDTKEKTSKIITLLLEEYNKYNQLTNYEIEVFKTFYKLANAMQIIQTSYLAKTGHDSKENQYWLNEGLAGYSFGDDLKLNFI